jgi:hypothetical protein
MASAAAGSAGERPDSASSPFIVANAVVIGAEADMDESMKVRT